MGDKIKYTVDPKRMEDSRGNVATLQGVFCAEAKNIVPIKKIAAEQKHVLSAVSEAAMDKEIDLGDFPSPLQTVCEKHTPEDKRHR